MARLPKAWWLIWLLLLPAAAGVAAQARGSPPTQPSAYWRYDAPGPLRLVTTADLDNDGIQEFLATTEEGQALLLGADGRNRWTYELREGGPVRQVATLNVEGAVEPGREILLVTDGTMLLLDEDQRVLWRKALGSEAAPVALEAYDDDGDGSEGFLLALSNGILQFYDGGGELTWQFPETAPVSDNAQPQLAVGDVDGDGQQDIAFSYYVQYSRLSLLEGNRVVTLARSLSGQVTALALPPLGGGGRQAIAIGKSFRDQHELLVLDESGEEMWRRTPNKPVTSLVAARAPAGDILLVGTSVGTVTAYDAAGTRIWRFQPDTASRTAAGLSPSPHVVGDNQPAVALTLMPREVRGGAAAEVVLLDNGGQRLLAFPLAAGSGQSRLVDSNGDEVSELLLASFGTLSLTDPGTGARKNGPAPNWPYRVSQPQSMLVADLDGDGQDELLVGAEGQIHLLESDDARTRGQLPLGGTITELALARNEQGVPFIVAANFNPPDPQTGEPTQETWVELWQASGRVAWTEPQRVSGSVTALAVGDLNGDGADEIAAGTDSGEVVAYNLQNEVIWRSGLGSPVRHLLAVDGGDDGAEELVAVTRGNAVALISGDGQSRVLTYYNVNDVDFVYPFPYQDRLGRALLIATHDGMLRGLTWEGQEVWRRAIGPGPLTIVRPADGDFLVGTADDSVHYYSVREDKLLWTLEEAGGVQDIYWGNLDGGSTHDVAIGNAAGYVFLMTGDRRQWDGLSLGSGVFRLAGLRLGDGDQTQLVTMAQNGVVQLFEAKPNRPPLLVAPETEVGPGQYVVRVTVIEEESDTVTVALQVWNEAEQQWIVQQEQEGEGSRDVSFIFNPAGDGPLRYRFAYNDGTNQGVVQPAPGPAPLPPAGLPRGLLLPAALVVALLSGILVVRQALSTPARASRFFNRIKQQPANTLQLVNSQYRSEGGSPDFLLSLANRARRAGNEPLANLANGLFLLETRPEAALPIINGALNEAKEAAIPWRRLDLWQDTYEMGRKLLEAPTITELVLLRPRLLHLVQTRQAAGQPAPGFETLLRVLASLRDSERVELAEDRTVYLHEATILLNQISTRLAQWPHTVENQLLAAVVERNLGLVRAEMEILRGQAQLVMRLKTKRLAAQDGHAIVALEIENHGRSPAENVVVILEGDPAYAVESAPKTLPVLSPGRSQQVAFQLSPAVPDRFRVAFSIHYDDRIQHGRRLAFADMVHLLPPVRDFKPIPNPYTPGTPLRRNSSLFYGREELFDFIADNVNRITGRNVLILVGQRRSGKTSALLRLAEQLPERILPVYIDCQSLGVLPGMAALLHDIAWLIADVLLARGYDVTVPPPTDWRDDPAGQFQRQFVPGVLAKLPPGTTLLLVFDEFEVFERLVADEILPPTFFSFLRHLMQHSEGLGFVFVGTQRLEEMGSDYWSVLFNIALYKQIGFLSQEAATRLICEPVAPHILYDDLALDKIWRVTAGQPYFLQLVCYTLVKRANEQGTGYVTISDVNAGLDEMLRLGEVHFAYIWQRSTRIERALLAAVAQLMDRDVPFHPADLMLYLEEYGFRFEPAEVTAGLTRLVEREILREITGDATVLYELKIGLVGLWAAQNKSLSRLYESGNGASEAQPVRREHV